MADDVGDLTNLVNAAYLAGLPQVRVHGCEGAVQLCGGNGLIHCETIHHAPW